MRRIGRPGEKGGLQTVLLAGVLLGVAAGGGCAFTDMTLAVPARSQPAVGPGVGRGREVAVVVPFADRRAVPGRCGMKKNGYNMDTANVICPMPPGQLLAGVLVQELAASGFRVLRDPRQAGPSTLVIHGEVGQLFVEPKIGFFTVTPEADIALKLTATTASGLYAERRFYLKGEEVSLGGTDGNMQLAFEAALRQTVGATVAAIAGLLDQFPSPPPAPVAVSVRVEAAGEGVGR